jgi:peptidoglycan/LPS O-acetylase OafA/YrhL
MTESHKYITNLTPLRGLAALWVAIFHFQVVIAKFVYPWQTHLIEKGYLMVDLFFIMSGFIIYHVYGSNFERSINVQNLGQFMTARFARIYPMHFFTLSLTVCWVALVRGWSPVFSLKAIPANVFLLHSFGFLGIYTWNVPSWSISAEWWSYLVFPILAVFLFWRKRLAIAILMLLSILLYLSILFWVKPVDPQTHAAILTHSLDVSYDFGYLRGLAGFTTGILIYQLYRSQVLKNLFEKDLSGLLCIGICLAFLHLGLNDVFNIPVFALIVLCIASNKGKLHGLCNNRLAQYLGLISYSIYMDQIFILTPFLLRKFHLPGVEYQKTLGYHTDFWTGFVFCICYLMVLIGIASITYFLIEVPCRKFINAKWAARKLPWSGA